MVAVRPRESIVLEPYSDGLLGAKSENCSAKWKAASHNTSSILGQDRPGRKLPRTPRQTQGMVRLNQTVDLSFFLTKICGNPVQKKPL